MAFGNRFILFLILIVSQTYAEARSLATYSTWVDEEVPRDEAKVPEAAERNEHLCMLCEEYTALATDYLYANKTELIDTLHVACSQLHFHEQQCVKLVDHYSTILFSEIAKIRPGEFCMRENLNLCEKRYLNIPLQMEEQICMLCHRVMDEILTKLNDPDSQFEIIKKLLKECEAMGHYMQQCKRLVLHYGPLILVAGEKFLESNDICASIHACGTQARACNVNRVALA